LAEGFSDPLGLGGPRRRMSPWRRFADWLAGEVPEALADSRELYASTLWGTVAALFSHVLFGLIFWALGVGAMALFNVGSCVIWIVAVGSVRKGRLDVALTLATIEIVAHAWAATIYLGMAPSFHFYIILVVVVVALLTNFRLRNRLAVGGFAIVSYIALVIYANRHPALVAINQDALDGLVALNTSTFMTILGGLCYFYAVTFNRAHQSLSEKNQRLEEALTKLEEAQEQIVVQQRLAYLGTLTAGIAHEIKNPLNFVKNFASLSVDLMPDLKEVSARLAAGQATPEDRAEFDECLEHLEQNNKKVEEHCLRADKVVQSMLLHSGTSSGEIETTDINALLRSSAELAKHDKVDKEVAPGSRVEMVMDLQENLPEALVIPRDLARAFLNILGNAVKAADGRARDEGPGFQPKVTITTRYLEPTISVRIRDNGKGIPKMLLERVFNPFFTTRPTGEGTGLGLSISYDIVVGQHCGKLWAESVVGEYAEFCIEFPRRPMGM
jgi:signal transduction histidine kinase